MPIQGFPFSADERADVLILGSMPGVESLRLQQYYAHRRNLFWTLMGELFDAGWDLPYPERLSRLRDCRVALWDVAHTCHRSGSLDADITDAIPNDFGRLFAVAPRIHTVFFNGQKAATLFRQLVTPMLSRELRLLTLLSTSPANAAIPLVRKRSAWAQIREALER